MSLMELVEFAGKPRTFLTDRQLMIRNWFSDLISQFFEYCNSKKLSANFHLASAWREKNPSDPIGELVAAFLRWASEFRDRTININKRMFKTISQELSLHCPEFGTWTEISASIKNSTKVYDRMNSAHGKIVHATSVTVQRALPCYRAVVERLLRVCSPDLLGLQMRSCIWFLHETGAGPEAFEIPAEGCVSTLFNGHYAVTVGCRSELLKERIYALSEFGTGLLKILQEARKNLGIENHVHLLFGFSSKDYFNQELVRLCNLAGFPKMQFSSMSLKYGFFGTCVGNLTLQGRCSFESIREAKALTQVLFDPTEIYSDLANHAITIATEYIGKYDKMEELSLEQVYPQLYHKPGERGHRSRATQTSTFPRSF